MIHYDPHRWFDHFFDIRGSLLKEIGARVTGCTLFAAIVVAFHFWVRPVGTSVVLHSMVGVALGLLLVFRTNASYDRYWEGRKLWGGIVNETRNLIRGAREHFGGDQDLMARLTCWTAMFPWAVIRALRGDDTLGPSARFLSEEERAAALSSQHPALHAAQRMTACLAEARAKGHIGDYIYGVLDKNIQLLVDYLGGCERIRKTPLPFAYVVHLRRALIIYCFTLPFALVETYGWYAVLDTLVVSYIFFGIEEIGVEIEGPFGDDENDLPMEDMSETIRKNVYALAEIGHEDREVLPSGL